MRKLKDVAGKKHSITVPAQVNMKCRQVNFELTREQLDKVIICCVQGLVCTIDLKAGASGGGFHGNLHRVDTNARLQLKFYFKLKKYGNDFDCNSGWLDVGKFIDEYHNYFDTLTVTRPKLIGNVVGNDVFQRAKKLSFLLSADAQSAKVLTLSSGGNHLIIDDVINLIMLKSENIPIYDVVIEHFAQSAIAQNIQILTFLAARSQTHSNLAGTKWRHTPAAFDSSVLSLPLGKQPGQKMAHALSGHVDWRWNFLKCDTLTEDEKKSVYLLKDSTGKLVIESFNNDVTKDGYPLDDIDILLAEGKLNTVIHDVIRGTRNPRRFLSLVMSHQRFARLGAIWQIPDLMGMTTTGTLVLTKKQNCNITRLQQLLIGLSQLYAIECENQIGIEACFEKLNKQITKLLKHNPGAADTVLEGDVVLHQNAIDTVKKMLVASDFRSNDFDARTAENGKPFLY